jgi:hypothetical protein
MPQASDRRGHAFDAALSMPHVPRSALALGVVGALGEELLAGLLGAGRYATVHVAVSQPIASATARFSPWVMGDVVAADDAYVCITGPEAFVPKASPMVRISAHDAPGAARTARSCGATRLVLVSPLPALLQLNAASHTLSSAGELEISELGFETLLVVRPTVDPTSPSGNWPQRLVRALTRMVLDIMLPPQVQALRARTAALAILEAVRRSRPGIHVLGARELSAIVAETMPDALLRKPRLR